MQNPSRTCAHYYSLPWKNLVSQCLVGNSEDFDITAGCELPGDLLQSDLYFFLGARYLTTLLSFYDPPKLHLVWFSFYKRCGSDILQQRSSKSIRQLSPMYTNLQMNVLYLSIFSTDLSVFSCCIFLLTLTLKLKKTTYVKLLSLILYDV